MHMSRYSELESMWRILPEVPLKRVISLAYPSLLLFVRFKISELRLLCRSL